MALEKNAKIASLAISVIVILIYIIYGGIPELGIREGAGVYQRFGYHLAHGSLLHVLLNVWCLLSIMFVYDISFGLLIVAYVLASLFPVDSLHLIMPYSNSLLLPTIGLSGICYCLMGMIAFRVKRKLYYQMWLLFYICIGFLFPNVNGWIHLYCYVAGLCIAFLTKPIK